MQWITCNNIYDEVWMRLLEFANIEIAVEEIQKRHGVASNDKIKANYMKQAKQIRVALLQAKEYFEAIENSSLITKANHLYYGAISLSTACMLLLGDGKKSLDYLRNDNKNSNHGLDLTVGANAESAKIGLNLLELCHVKIRADGFFKNWYETLPDSAGATALVTRHQDTSYHTFIDTIAGFETPRFETIKDSKFNLISLIKHLPDLNSEILRYGVEVPSSRISHQMHIRRDHVEHIWKIHNTQNYYNLKKIIDKFVHEAGPKSYFCYNIYEGSAGGVISIKLTEPEVTISYPSCRTTIDHTQICYSDDIIQHELVDAFMVCYGLSMLSRYFPDLWVSCLESHCKASKLIERCIDSLKLKIPIMTLSFMAGREYVISTHRPYWYKA